MKNTPLWCIFYLNSSGIIGLKHATQLPVQNLYMRTSFNSLKRSSNNYKFAHSRHKCAERAKSISRNQDLTKHTPCGCFLLNMCVVLNLNHRSKVVQCKREPDEVRRPHLFNSRFIKTYTCHQRFATML